MRNITLNNQALEDLQYWVQKDIKLLRKIFDLFVSITRNSVEGIGKPEALKEHRIIYSFTHDAIIVISCRSHYKF